MSEKVTVKVERSVLHLPAIALRGLVVFPNNLLHFEVGREKSIAAVEWAVSNNSDVFLVAQKEMKVEDPKAADLYTYGVVAEVKQVMRVSDDLVRIWSKANTAPDSPRWRTTAASCWPPSARPRSRWRSPRSCRRRTSSSATSKEL